MRVAIEARGLTGRGGGTRRYTRELTQGLLALPGDNEFIVFDEGPAHQLLLPWWLEVTMPRRLRAAQPDVIHFTKAAIPRRKIAPTVVTIYDVIPLLFPESQMLARRWYWPRTLRHAAQASDHIVTISEASKQDISAHLQVDAEKITATPLAVDRSYFRPVPATDFVRQASGDQPYVLFVGTIEPRKNVPLLIRAFTRIARDVPHRLLIAGREYKDGAAVAAAIEQSQVADRIVQLSFISAEDLPALYANADLFVWPSVYEGWGFPPQEAMACGTPVIVSDGGSLPEAVGGAGEIVPFAAPLRERTEDADFEQRLAQAMEDVLTDEAKRAVMREAGLKRVRQFSWQNVAEQTLRVYRQAVHL